MLIEIGEEEREILLEALDGYRRKHRDHARPRPDRRDEFDPMAARLYHKARELRDRIQVAL